MPKLIVKIQVYDEIIFVDKLFNHSIIHVHKDTERKGKKNQGEYFNVYLMSLFH